MKDNLFDDEGLDALGTFKPVGSSALVRPALATCSGTRHTEVEIPARALPGNLYRYGGKRIMDVLITLISLPVILPVTLLCAFALLIEGGNPFYRQHRLGKNGKTFSILKLRTMCRDADQILEQYLAADPALRAEWDHSQKLRNDPRITRVGAFLRKTSLDELPQFWNVLTGEMSIVGPRPMMPEQLVMYEDPAPYFDMLPGITGQWQVSDRNQSSFSHRSTVDAHYHQHLSLWQDIRILFQTVDVVIRRTGC